MSCLHFGCDRRLGLACHTLGLHVVLVLVGLLLLALTCIAPQPLAMGVLRLPAVLSVASPPGLAVGLDTNSPRRVVSSFAFCFGSLTGCLACMLSLVT